MSGKQKGNQFERDMCKQLSLWWTNNKHDDVFWRAQNSGARATVRSRVGKATRGQYGDVCATDGRGIALTKVCVISLKRGYQGATIGDFLEHTNPLVEPQYAKWLREVERDRKAAGVPGWLLIVRRNNREALIFCNEELLNAFEFNNYQTPKVVPRLLEKNHLVMKVTVRNKEYTKEQVRYRLAKKKQIKQTLFLMTGWALKDFFKIVKKDDFKSLAHAQKNQSKKLSKDKKAKRRDR
jgi:hypothetical protein